MTLKSKEMLESSTFSTEKGSKEKIDAIETTDIEEFMVMLKTSRDGLPSSEAHKRFLQHGPNAIEEKKGNPFLKFLKYFWGPLPWLIEFAAILSGIVQDYSDLSIILFLLVINACIGFFQEYKADTEVEKLKEHLAVNTKVKRDGTWNTMQARELVPGDVIHFRLGDLVPADVKIIESENVEIDQSALTGESLPVYKQPGNVAFMGSAIRRGEGDAVVFTTGSKTFFGETASLVQQSKNVSHYLKSVLKIGKFLILMSVSLVILIMIVALLRNNEFVQLLKFCLILTVASIPVALPAVLSVVMAAGASILAKNKALVTRLVAIEEMASMDVLCADKTGTLTQNKMILGESFLAEGITEDELILNAAIASRVKDEDTIEKVIFSNLKGGLDVLNAYTVENYIPFDPTIKRTEATVNDGTRVLKYSKGAPQKILELCDDDNVMKDAVIAKVEDFASRGYRTLAVARTDNTGLWHFRGLISLFDPPHADSKSTIDTAKNKGITVKMITGDNQAIAKEMAKNLDIGPRIAKFDDIFKNEVATNIDLDSVDGFAEVYPENKYQIVEALQKQGHYVGMTGDGVNDAPALKRADVGIAVADATDVAKSAADLVLTSPGISTILKALDESRKIFNRMTSYAIYRIAETIRIILFMTLSILIYNFYPITTIMIILLALLNDLPIMMIAYDNAYSADTPIHWEMTKVLGIASLLGILGVISSFILFFILESIRPSLDTTLIQSIMFLKLMVAGHLTIYLTRSTQHYFWQRPFPSGRLFWTTELTQLVATLFAAYGVLMSPIGWAWAGIVWLYALSWFVFNNFVKVHMYRFFTRLVSNRDRKALHTIHQSLHTFGMEKASRIANKKGMRS
ncbi:MAG TPA: plasma-membrane proton-efflux P-type ATPase [Candidatus Lokiarchaeia archaeon]|nr:plasma-membrane proton-efflux P-type ATPase [Candidatus Lokiarchaeia archaeon]